LPCCEGDIVPGHDNVLRRARWHLGLLVTATFLLLPVAFAVLASFKSAHDLYGANPLPLRPTLDNYRVAIGQLPIVRLLVNTLVMSAGVMNLQLLVATLAGYALVRFHTRLGQLVLLVGTVSVLIPAQALLIPLFLMVSHLGWLNSYTALIVPQLSSCAVAVLLLRQHVAAIPASLNEAVLLDGANSWQALWHIVLPLLRPALGAVAISCSSTPGTSTSGRYSPRRTDRTPPFSSAWRCSATPRARTPDRCSRARHWPRCLS